MVVKSINEHLCFFLFFFLLSRLPQPPFSQKKKTGSFGMRRTSCVTVTHKNTLMLGTAHEHKQALAWQALSHAKGHYLAAVSFNRSVAGWETDPGSVPKACEGALSGSNNAPAHPCRRARVHTLGRACERLPIRPPSEKVPRRRSLCHYSVHLAYCLSGRVCLCVCRGVCVCAALTAMEGYSAVNL